MSNGLIALFFGLGVGGWSYGWLARHNGNASPANTAKAAGVIGLIAALVIFTVMKFILNV